MNGAEIGTLVFAVVAFLGAATTYIQQRTVRHRSIVSLNQSADAVGIATRAIDKVNAHLNDHPGGDSPAKTA